MQLALFIKVVIAWQAFVTVSVDPVSDKRVLNSYVKKWDDNGNLILNQLKEEKLFNLFNHYTRTVFIM
jgi:cytochrome oxidase Cu insertion factor (SCO1/SenC/PrrC family)